MIKIECIPSIDYSDIGEISVSIELTQEQIETVKNMTKVEFKQFVLLNATVRVTDFDVKYDVPDFENWNFEL